MRKNVLTITCLLLFLLVGSSAQASPTLKWTADPDTWYYEIYRMAATETGFIPFYFIENVENPDKITIEIHTTLEATSFSNAYTITGEPFGLWVVRSVYRDGTKSKWTNFIIVSDPTLQTCILSLSKKAGNF